MKYENQRRRGLPLSEGESNQPEDADGKFLEAGGVGREGNKGAFRAGALPLPSMQHPLMPLSVPFSNYMLWLWRSENRPHGEWSDDDA